MELTDRRILITGPTSQVGRPVASALAPRNEVIGLARFSDDAARADLEAVGVRCVPVDLVDPDFSAVPTDVDVVLNFAVTKTGDFAGDLAANAEATGLLMHHLDSADAFLHCSSTGVYQPDGARPFTEDSPLGDHHRVMFPTYSIAKIAAETMVRFGARDYGMPSVIARLNVPYGDGGGWPWLHMEMILAGQPVVIHPDGPNAFNPIHDDDILASIPSLLDAAAVPAPTINWGGSETVSIEEWSTYLAELMGRQVTFETSEAALSSVPVDTTRFEQLHGPTSTDWRIGLRRMVDHLHPELELTDVGTDS